jgi:hypothetical protein
LFIGQAAFNVFSLKLCQVGCEQPAIAADIVAMGAQESQFFVDHRRHSFDGRQFFHCWRVKGVPRPSKK